MLDPLNLLCKWRMILAGWHTGTRSMSEPGTKAMRDLMDKWLVSRCESNATAALLIKKGVFTAEEFTEAVYDEARVLNVKLEEQFPGFRAKEDGMAIYDVSLANATMQRLGFPP